MPLPAPPAGRLLAAASLIGGVPATLLLVLLAAGGVAPLPGFLVLVATIVAALWLARIWLVNLAQI
jgi:hypothetical protein